MDSTHCSIPVLELPRTPQCNTAHNQRWSKEAHQSTGDSVDILLQVWLTVLDAPLALLDTRVEREVARHDWWTEFVEQIRDEEAEELCCDVEPAVP